MAHAKFKFISMEDKPVPDIDEELRMVCVRNLNAIDAELHTGVDAGGPDAKELWRCAKRRKWAFAESLEDEDSYRYACWWIQNQ